MFHHQTPPTYSPYPPSQSEHDRPEQLTIERSPLARGGAGVLALAALLLLLLVGAIAYFDIVPILRDGSAQVAAVRQFCADEVRQDYAAAYELLASSYTLSTSLPKEQFVRALAERDQEYGQVRACAITGRDYVGTFASTAFGEVQIIFQVMVTLDDGSHSGNVAAVSDHGWKVRYLDSQLHLDR
jgi:hypothetical protein